MILPVGVRKGFQHRRVTNTISVPPYQPVKWVFS